MYHGRHDMQKRPHWCDRFRKPSPGNHSARARASLPEYKYGDIDKYPTPMGRELLVVVIRSLLSRLLQSHLFSV